MIQERIQKWLDGPYDEETKEEIRALLKTDPIRLQEAFFKDLSFGTGGLRAKVGVGTNRLNRYTIQMATQGLANYLHQQFSQNISVFIGYDVRKHSALFAKETARVLAGNGIRALITKDICPTPLVSFGCRHFQTSAAIVITASHNPPEYNGYKVYWKDGGQIVAPHDKGIIEEVRKIKKIDEVKLAPENSPLIEWIDSSLDEAYLEKLICGRLQLNLSPLHVVYTPLHGTGIRIMQRALSCCGASVSLVEEQSAPDGAFPNVKTPNPEEPEALELGAKKLLAENGDLLLGTDPDADRVGAAIIHEKKPVFLTGNQIACLCLYHICEAFSQKGGLPPESACIKTIVTTELFKKIAEGYGASCFDVLTGFKYIAAKIDEWEKTKAPYQYLFGGEESFGFLFGSFVRDKDAISSSCLLAETAAFAKGKGLTLLDLLYKIYERYGVHRESLTNIALPDNQAGLDTVKRLMSSLRKDPPLQLNGRSVRQIDDYELGISRELQTGKQVPIDLPQSDVLRFWLDDESKLVIRPSGTEPKIKIYAETVEKGTNIPRAIAASESKLLSLLADFKKILWLSD